MSNTRSNVAKALLGELPLTTILSASENRDLEICKLRISGMRLETIGARFNMTRERVRQICANVEAGLVKRLMTEQKAANLDESLNKASAIAEFIAARPGITLSELVSAGIGFTPQSLVNVPKPLRKLILTTQNSRVYRQKFSDEDCLVALRKASTYYFPLSHDDYERLIELREVDGPSVPLLAKRFGSWSGACRAAGVESRASHDQYKRNWSTQEMTSIVCAFLTDTSVGGSVADYDSWRASQSHSVPSSVYLRNTFGGWPAVTSAALESLRNNWGGSSQHGE